MQNYNISLSDTCLFRPQWRHNPYKYFDFFEGWMLPTDVAWAPSTACYRWNFHEIIHLILKVSIITAIGCTFWDIFLHFLGGNWGLAFHMNCLPAVNTHDQGFGGSSLIGGEALHCVIEQDTFWYPLLSSISTQKMSWHDWKIVDWEVKHQQKILMTYPVLLSDWFWKCFLPGTFPTSSNNQVTIWSWSPFYTWHWHYCQIIKQVSPKNCKEQLQK